MSFAPLIGITISPTGGINHAGVMFLVSMPPPVKTMYGIRNAKSRTKGTPKSQKTHPRVSFLKMNSQSAERTSEATPIVP